MPHLVDKDMTTFLLDDRPLYDFLRRVNLVL